MPYWRLFYHVVWATKERQPLIHEGVASQLHQRLVRKAMELKVMVHAVGGVEDHVHLVVSVPPSLALSEFVRLLKGSSSYFVSHELVTPRPFAWQADYGVLSFEARQLDKMVQYVTEQREHHTKGTTIPILERLRPQEEELEKVEQG